MGQPKLPRAKFETPNHPWQGDRIKAEHELRKKYGLKNKSEIWKAQSRLRDIRAQARVLISRHRNPSDTQARRESDLLVRRLFVNGYVGESATLNDVLGLDLERILSRRLQSQVYLKGLARTPGQARQFVSHGHIRIGDRRVTVPGYVVRRQEEEQVLFDPESAVADEAHPVRPKAPGMEPEPEAEPEPAPTAAAAPHVRGPARAPGRDHPPGPRPAAKPAEGKPDASPGEADAKPAPGAKGEARAAAEAAQGAPPAAPAAPAAKPASGAKPAGKDARGKAEAKPKAETAKPEEASE